MLESSLFIVQYGIRDNRQRTTDNRGGYARQRTIDNGRRGMLKVERGERVLRFQEIKMVKV